MSDKTEQGIQALKQQLSLLPEALSRTILDRIRQAIHYEPVIGIMGKTGTGKSSICNALFQQPLSPVSNVEGCTREPLRFTLNAGGRCLTLVDLPGAGESLDSDREYLQLYKEQLPKLDLILWVIKGDDRASATDETFHRFLLECGVSPGSIVFVINQADKAEPSEEWDWKASQPSNSQVLTLIAKSSAVSRQFSSPYPVHAVSAKTSYNLSRLVETLIFALPSQASSGMFRQAKEHHRTRDAEITARNDFGDLIGDLFSRVVEGLPLPKIIRDCLSTVRDGVVNVAGTLWHWFF
ncbi:GTPase [Rouxiella badensis]|uniref:GTPase family protein n=1 Tax=Rouxiella badensis TaxID=1646377 RepID=UPI0028D4A2F4|nr:GTPase [Rouxiella badensis]